MEHYDVEGNGLIRGEAEARREPRVATPLDVAACDADGGTVARDGGEVVACCEGEEGCALDACADADGWTFVVGPGRGVVD